MRNSTSLALLVALAIVFLALNVIGSHVLKGVRVDLTENRLYTLSEGTRSLLGRLEEPINLYLYFSEESSRDLPTIRSYANRVEELLREMEERSGGMLRVMRVDARPFSEEEDEAERFGLQAVPVGSGDQTLYLGVVGTNAVDGVEVIPFLQPDQEAFLEYELARIVQILKQPEAPRVGILSGLPIAGGMDAMRGQQTPPWVVYEQIEQLFQVEDIDAEDEQLPEGLEALVLIHPAGVPEAMMRQIDQFVLAGGRLLAFVDPLAESAVGPSPMDPFADGAGAGTSSLSALFEAWGLVFDQVNIVADLELALQVSMQAGQPPSRHPGIIGATGEALSADDVVTADLPSVNLSSAGYFELREGSSLGFEPLITSSRNAGLLPADRLQWLEDPSVLLGEVEPDGSRYTLMARLSGRVPSAFDGAEEDPDALDEGEISVIVVGDTDLLADRFWVQRQSMFGQSILSPFAGNGDLVINAIDNLLGDADLIQVRSRALAHRPFERVDALRRTAERELQSTQDRLEAELQEAETRLGELQRARGDTDLAVMTPEQEAEIDRFLEQRLEIRRELRQVRRDLDRDIEDLGTRLKLFNIMAMPALVTLFVLIFAWRRRRQRGAAR